MANEWRLGKQMCLLSYELSPPIQLFHLCGERNVECVVMALGKRQFVGFFLRTEKSPKCSSKRQKGSAIGT